MLVRTIIGAVVEVPEGLYESNKNVFTPVEEHSSKAEESSDKAMTDIENTAVKPKKK